jgi:hypothetical protein
MACELAEKTGREIIRRWLRGVSPELWNHQGRHPSQKHLSAIATYEPGEGYTPAAVPGDSDNLRAFYAGRWVPKTITPDAAQDG